MCYNVFLMGSFEVAVTPIEAVGIDAIDMQRVFDVSRTLPLAKPSDRHTPFERAFLAARLGELDQLAASTANPLHDEELTLDGVRLQLAPRLITKRSGGRPSDPSWDVAMRIPMSAETEIRLADVARHVSTKERRVAPSQLAAFLVEKGLDNLADQAV